MCSTLRLFGWPIRFLQTNLARHRGDNMYPWENRRQVPWYLACSELNTAKHRETEVAWRNREPHKVFGQTLTALDSGSDCARYVNGSSRCISTGHSATPTQFSTSS